MFSFGAVAETHFGSCSSLLGWVGLSSSCFLLFQWEEVWRDLNTFMLKVKHMFKGTDFYKAPECIQSDFTKFSATLLLCPLQQRGSISSYLMCSFVTWGQWTGRAIRLSPCSGLGQRFLFCSELKLNLSNSMSSKVKAACKGIQFK